MKKAILIVLSVLLMGFLIFFYGFNVYNKRYSNFKGSGYIISKVYNDEGNYIKSEKYYFNDSGKYKKNYIDGVEFNNVDNKKVSVSTDSFIHYDNGNISLLKKSAILNFDEVNKNSSIKYYNLLDGMVLEKQGDTYKVSNSNNKVTFNNYIVKINDNKYMLVGSRISLKMGETEKTIENGYYEIEFFDGDIVRIENNEVSYQTVPTNTFLELSNGIKIELDSKNIYKNGDKIVSLNEITIDSDDNIELKEDKKEIATIEESNESNNNNNNNNNNNQSDDKINNPVNGIGNGIVGGDDKSDGEEVNEYEKETDPTFRLSDVEITSNKLKGNIEIADPSNILKGDIVLKLIESNSNKTVYLTKEVEGTMNISFDIETLSPETSYIFVVTSSYKKGDNEYTRDFIQRNIVTDSIGVSVEKDYFTTNSLAFTVSKKDYSNVKGLDIVLYNDNDKVVSMLKADFSTGNEVSIEFSELLNNLEYTLKTQNYIYDDSIISDYQLVTKSYKTLKTKPILGTIDFTIDKKNSLFTLSSGTIKDVDNGVTSLRYEIYDARNLDDEDAKPVKTIEKNGKGSIDVNVDGTTIERGVPYAFKIVATFNDNEKQYEYETELSTVMKLDGVEFPTVKFDKTNVTFERITGNLVIVDDSNTIPLYGDNLITVIYTDSLGISNSFTSSGSLTIPFDKDNLRKNETYTISVYATVDLEDGNPVINDCYIGSAIVKTEDTNDMYLNWSVDSSNVSSTFKINSKLSSYDNKDTDLEANTMTGIVFKLYDGVSTNGNCVKTVRISDSNSNHYVSDLREKYYDNEFEITPALFNLKNQDLNSSYYTIEVQGVYDYTTYENKTNVRNNIITVKSSGYVPSLPPDINDALDVQPIYNKDAGDLYKSELDGQTIIGYKVKAFYDNTNKFAVTFDYKLFNNKTGKEISKKTYTVPENGSIDYVYFYLNNGTSYSVDDVDFRRGSSYYFTYTAELDLNLDDVIDTTYPTDSGVELKSKIITPSKQQPTIKMYPSISTDNSFTWKYLITDIDNALIENKFNYSTNGYTKTSIPFTINSSYNQVTFIDLQSGYLEVNVNQALVKDDDFIKTKRLIYQKYDRLSDASGLEYYINVDINRLIISFKDYLTKPIFDKVAGARVEFTSGSSKVVLDNQIIENGNIIIDFADIESLISKDITLKVFLYYDSGITGFDTGSNKVAFQTIDDGTDDNTGKYMFMNTQSSFITNATASNSLFKAETNITNKQLKLTDLKNNNIQTLTFDIKEGGIKYNYGYILLKTLKEKEVVNTTTNNFRFDKIIPSISLIDENGNRNISPRIASVDMKIKLYGSGNNRIKDNKIYVEMYHTDDKGLTSTYAGTKAFTIDKLSKIISFDKGDSTGDQPLIPRENYYFKVYADVLDGTEYKKNYLYDVDEKKNTVDYTFKTLGDVGITNIETKYFAESYERRFIQMKYKLKETMGYDRIEYEVYKITKNSDGSTSNTLVELNTNNSTFFDSEMTINIPIPPGCGVNSKSTYRVLIRPYAKHIIDGNEEDIELVPNNSATFSLIQLAEPYVGVGSSVDGNNLNFKVNFYDNYKAVVNSEYTVKFVDENGNDITPSEYGNNKTYTTTSTGKFNLTNVTAKKIEMHIKYKINIVNDIDSFVDSEKIYQTSLISLSGINIGNMQITTDFNDTSKMRLAFYDSDNIEEIDTIRYSVYSNNGYSKDVEVGFTPVYFSVDETTYYYYFTLDDIILPETARYYLQIQFVKDGQVVTEESGTYNYIK